MSELLGNQMSPAEFARRMKVERSTVSRWISKDRDMTYEHAVMAARILGCHAEDMYEWIETDKR
ncbi:helix-turn-helix domain-containing protein [Paenibacillus ehimensis]|uniref:helix-turn-helix domain-containing protein n=1 Tax=Paenibacillus ehimensis TaxID=79264 RepID=UPI000687EC8C|nr:helix-turn-helix transcriptional regulator [Paenibacillus ehimensis]